MAVIKNEKTKIDVEEYQFSQFNDIKNNGSGTPFTPLQFDTNKKIDQKLIKQERNQAAGSSFKFDSDVESYRGLRNQKEREYEERIQNEVTSRLEALKEKATEDAYQQGLKQGEEEAKKMTLQKLEVKIEDLEKNIQIIQKKSQEILEQNKDQVYKMVHNLTKWIVLKEVDEKYYLSRLLEKLIYEINQKQNLVVRVDEESFGYIPEVIKVLERKLGVLPNLRVEIGQELEGPGIILESENSIVDGSFESQMNNLDNLFKLVGKYE